MTNKKSLLLIMLFFLVGIIFIYFNQQGSIVNDNRGNKIKLYFATKDAMYLQAEERTISTTDKTSRYKETVNQLIEGPESNKLTATIPRGVKLLDLDIKGDTAYLSFNQALVDNHWGGSTGEIMTVYSIVNTMTQFPQISSVKIMIGDEEIESLAGHLDLSVALERDEKIIKETKK